MTGPYGYRLRVRLFEMRRANPRRSFESAWTEALRVDRPPSDWTPVLEWAKRYFRLAYIRQGDGAVSLLVERDEGRVIDFPPAPSEPDARRCGSGEGCRRFAREGGFLCEDHSAEIHAAFKRAEYRGRDDFRHEEARAA